MGLINPMLANPVEIVDLEKKCKGYVMEPKLDGMRCIIDGRSRPVEMYSRTGHDLAAKVPHLTELFEGSDIVLDGEICWRRADGTVDFNQTMRIMGSGVDEAIRKQDEVGPVDFVMFDFLGDEYGDCITLSYKERRQKLIAQGATYSDMSSHVHRVVPMFVTTLASQLVVYERWVANGFEGAMFKNPNASYVQGKRPANNWYKLKKFHTMDVVIMQEYEPGTGKYTGMVGAVNFGYWPKGASKPVYLGKCSGMDDSRRAAMTTNWDTYAGQVMEIRHFGKVGRNTTGLRHPQFVRMRIDKDPKDCTEAQ